MSTEENVINGLNVTELLQYVNKCRSDPSIAERDPTLVAHWVGGDRSRIESEDIVTHIGGKGELNSMGMLLASLAACDVDVVVTHASLLGLKIENLSVEATGHFEVRSYLGLDDAPGSGYDRIAYTVRIRAPRRDTGTDRLFEGKVRAILSSGRFAGKSDPVEAGISRRFQIAALEEIKRA